MKYYGTFKKFTFFKTRRQLTEEKITKKEKNSVENNSEINGNNVPVSFEPTPLLIENNCEAKLGRLITQEKNLIMEKNLDLVTEKLTNEKISEEENVNDTKREPVVVVSFKK